MLAVPVQRAGGEYCDTRVRHATHTRGLPVLRFLQTNRATCSTPLAMSAVARASASSLLVANDLPTRGARLRGRYAPGAMRSRPNPATLVRVMRPHGRASGVVCSGVPPTSTGTMPPVVPPVRPTAPPVPTQVRFSWERDRAGRPRARGYLAPQYRVSTPPCSHPGPPS